MTFLIPNLWVRVLLGYVEDQLGVRESDLGNGGKTKHKNILEFRFLKFVWKTKVKIVLFRKTMDQYCEVSGPTVSHRKRPPTNSPKARREGAATLS
ncbi:hypothetical protein AVEN_204710-1 [Araneus ventricosus]|uniref:Uncharacterized protein n=1 Tax=Araneus ventricosus TaxID=182803 RepID=A0A4Y2M7P1_ARAVE|nr:hypothetical protein AVEN_204710-1 [Araneus ventricosus]